MNQEVQLSDHIQDGSVFLTLPSLTSGGTDDNEDHSSRPMMSNTSSKEKTNPLADVYEEKSDESLDDDDDDFEEDDMFPDLVSTLPTKQNKTKRTLKKTNSPLHL